ncbi:MAG: ATP-binding protein [Bacteroidales bacterium]|nr:ATP-binding protein [Bacteroidales bacterium]
MKEILKEIIRTNQNRDFSDIRSRDLRIPINAGKIITLIGPRRSGKSSLLQFTIKELLRNGTKKDNILFINFEDERLNFDQSNLDLIIQAYRELYPDNNIENCYFFFDEIQNAEGWDRFISRIFENISKNIFLTGSNAKFLSAEISTVLRGRAISYILFPLSFSEFLSFLSIEKDIYNVQNKALIINAFDNFLIWGGFPELVNMESTLKTKVLQEYFNVMIYRDLIERFSISDPHVLKYFIKKVIANITKPLSINRIYNELKSNKYTIGKNSLYQFLDQVSDIFLVRLVNKFDYSQIRREQYDKKAYIVDNGLISSVNYNLSNDYGKLLENLIALEIQKNGYEVFFFKSLKECDFIMKISDGFIPIQVSYTFYDNDTKNREINGLLKASQVLDARQGYIITFDLYEEIKKAETKIHILPAYRFLLHDLKSF